MTRALAPFVIALAACRPPARSAPPDRPSDPVVLQDTRAIDVPPFVARQRVTARYGDRSHTFDAVLQLAGGRLTMLGLSPFGTKAFVLTQTGTDVHFETFVSLDLPFPPERILFDVHRALFWNARDGTVTADGRRRRVTPAFTIVERLDGRRVTTRTFLDRAGHTLAIVRFSPPIRPGEIPRRVEIAAPPYGYDLRIDTIETHPLGGAPAGGTG